MLEGSAVVDGNALGRRDSAGIWDVEQVELKTTADATDILIVETLMIDDDRIRTWEAEQAHHH